MKIKVQKISRSSGQFSIFNFQFSIFNSAPPSPRHAFTLVELLLVLVILGILAAIVIPKFSGRTEQAKEQAAVTQISSLSTALNNFEVDNGAYPKGKNGLQDLIVQPRDAANWH